MTEAKEKLHNLTGQILQWVAIYFSKLNLI